jgi:hypothetical protein
MNIEEKLKNRRRNEVKGQGKGNCKQPQYFWSTKSEYAEKEAVKNVYS